MTTLETLGLQVTPISSTEGKGYALSYRDNVQMSLCVIVGNGDGKISYSSIRTFDTFSRDDAIALLTDNPTDTRAHAPWAFAMIGGDRMEDLMDQ
jgi:hypothetical protein